MYYLLDGDNFFASVEVLYAPHLRHKELVVLSSADGNVVARSKLAKKNGVKMGVPYFQIKDEFEARGGVAHASNFPLYARSSVQVACAIESLLGPCDRYSIDESFGVSDGLEITIDKHGGHEAYARFIKNTVQQQTGIAISVGVGATKTLAKAAAYGAKKYPATKGVVAIESRERLEKLLKLMPVGNVWGIGRKFEEKLLAMGISTAWDLKSSDQARMRKVFGVTLQRVIAELNGEVCFGLEFEAPAQKQMVSSKTFTERVMDQDIIRGHLSQHAEKLASKLRNRKAQAKRLTIFIQNSPFDKSAPFRYLSRTAEFTTHSNDTSKFHAVIHQLLIAIWQNGLRYSKCGVMVSELVELKHKQLGLFDEKEPRNKVELMNILDKINAKQACGVSFASTFLKPPAIPSAKLSPNYTGSWSEVPKVH
ncbi:DUF4113 domain-containing protein [Marinomonas sp. TI.3.20]|uniref:Y-family DNA polymerase n=1 Tax=Marinomonas sp. TI.3.20 TaxID=3121296 RepID=UPI00311D999B